MIQFLQQKKSTLVFIPLVSVMVVLMSHDVGNRGGADVAGDILFRAGAPAVRAGSSVTTYVGDLFRNYVDLRGVRSENRRLSEALLRTEIERDRLRETAAAGQRLQDLLDLKQVLAAPGVAARVAGSGLASGGDTLLLDRGSSEGIVPGMPVVAVGGTVGRVTKVSADLAKVQCITDPTSGVAVTMQDSGYQGILFGTDRGSCEIHYLPPYAEVSHGDLVVTSGLDQIYPSGIPVGRIVGRPQGEGVSRRFEVKPLVDFQRMSEVLVLKVPPRPRQPGARDEGSPARRGRPVEPPRDGGADRPGGSDPSGDGDAKRPEGSAPETQRGGTGATRSDRPEEGRVGRS